MSQIFVLIVFIGIIVLIVAGVWRTFEKAGHPGWASIVPIYNYYIMTQIAGRAGWWTILLLIPYINFIFLIIVGIDIAKKFGKGSGFGVGLGLLGFIFWPILGLGDAEYVDTEPQVSIDQFGAPEDNTNTESEEKEQ